MKKFINLPSKLLVGLGVVASATPVLALDTTAAVASITASGVDVETVAVAIIAVAAIMFAIGKVRQLMKA